MSTYIGIAGSEDDLPPGGSPGNVLVLDANGQPAWVASSGGAVGADPSALVGLAVVPGAAVTFMRSDAAPPLNQAIAPTWSARHIFEVNSIASVPAATFTGSWFNAGTATTTKPHLLIEPTGAVSTGWSAVGTALGINAASAFAGNLIDAQSNGVSRFSVLSTGNASFGGFVATPSAKTITVGDSARPGIDVDKSGMDCIIRSGAGTGAALISNIQFQTPTAGVTGSAIQTYATRLSFNSNGMQVTGQLNASSNIQVGAGSWLFWPNGTGFFSNTVGVIQAGTGTTLDRIQLGGTTNLFPAIKRSLGTIQFRLADDSQDCPIKLKNITVSDTSVMMKHSGSWTNNAGAFAGTLTNAPVAGNPTKWIAINENGVTRYIPAW